MDYKWARDFTLQLINQYSTAGTIVPESYNGQADYIVRIPKLLNNAQVHVATTAGKIRTAVPLSNLERRENGEWMIYTMPEDFWQLCSGNIILGGTEGMMDRMNFGHIIGSNQLAVPGSVGTDAIVEYYRLPSLLSDEPRENAELDNTVAAQMILPYYAAAHLVMQDNTYAYQALMNEFESRLARLVQPTVAVCSTVADAYGADGWGVG